MTARIKIDGQPEQTFGCYGSHWGITDLYDTFEAALRAAIDSGLPFHAQWGSKKEIQYAMVSRSATLGRIEVDARTEMDEGDDLIDTLVWEAFGKRHDDGYSALEAESNWFADINPDEGFDPGVEMERLQDLLSDAELIYGINESGESITLGDADDGEPSFEDVMSALEECMDGAEQENERRYRAAIEFIKQHFNLTEEEQA